jgi:hypothetical protein
MGLFDMFESFFNPQHGFEEAEKQARRGYGEAQGYLEPFRRQGMEQYPGLMEAMRKLMNPAELQSEWAKGYETSPYAKQLMQQARESGLEGASSMGLMGSSAALGNIEKGGADIMAKDRSQYMRDLMEKYLKGIGIGGDLYGLGAQTAGQMGRQGMEQGTTMANLGYGRVNAPGNLFENLLRMGVNAYAGSQAGGFGGAGGGNAYNPAFA